MFELITADQLGLIAKGKIEAYFNKHPEYDELLRNLDQIITANALSLKRNDGLIFVFNDETREVDGLYALSKFVKQKTLPVEKIISRKKIPVYKKGHFGKEVIDHYDEEVEKVTEDKLSDDCEEIAMLGKFMVIYLKLCGYKITNVQYSSYFYDKNGNAHGGESDVQFLKCLTLDY